VPLFLVGRSASRAADLPSGERANAFTNDEKVDYRYEQNTACEQHYARSSP
jgi:hypothetical protein